MAKISYFADSFGDDIPKWAPAPADGELGAIRLDPLTGPRPLTTTRPVPWAIVVGKSGTEDSARPGE